MRKLLLLSAVYAIYSSPACAIIPNSGPLTTNTIQGEFGGAHPNAMSEYYAGAGRVPPGTSGINGAVPSSGALAFSKFYGTSNFTGSTVDLTVAGTTDVPVPTGSTSVSITCVGGGGSGGGSQSDFGGDQYASGGGGASGAACQITRSLNGADTGLNIHCIVGGADTNSTVSATLSSGSINLLSQKGGFGGSAGSPSSPGAGGIASSSSGGDSNFNGNDGTGGSSSGSSGINGGAGGTPILLGAGEGGKGADAPGAASFGAVGAIRLVFT